jgi:hypothetical protein
VKQFVRKYFLIIIVILASVAILFLRLTKKVEVSPEPTLSPTPIPFELENIFPPPGEQEMGDPSIALQLTFTRPVDSLTVSVKIKPVLDVSYATSDGGKTLFIKPATGWVYKTNYDVSVSLKSQDGQELPAPVEFSFKFLPVEDSPLTEF